MTITTGNMHTVQIQYSDWERLTVSEKIYLLRESQGYTWEAGVLTLRISETALMQFYTGRSEE
jgi:hypothetical protein